MYDVHAFYFYAFDMHVICITIFSGMVVGDRSKRKNVVDEVFKQAKRKGAKEGTAPRQSSRSRSFPGSSRLLTDETVQPGAPQPPEEIVHNIYFWSNGFTVDDGPLRSFDDPEHASFLEVKDSDMCNRAYVYFCLLSVL